MDGMIRCAKIFIITQPSLPLCHGLIVFGHHSFCSRYQPPRFPVFRFEKGNIADTLKGFAVYKAEGTFNTDSSRVYRFIPNNDSAETGFVLSELIKDPQGRYFVTAISKTNNESDPILIYPLSTAGPLP
jgi:hypothetical protein